MIKLFQNLLQWLFLKAEGLFNAAFGDRINPFYHLGAITFFLFWIVGASGLYLYVFFETGIAEAYSSVIALTNNQWWAGGIMRSVHRYASDAMVLTMVLHMLRYFAFNLYHGFRWFSWVTGVMLIWMVYASGINGYMLPWDQLAQYVTVTSFEWLDWLPIFNGTLMRNFLYSDHVGDRFFTLLSFMHLGILLVLLMISLASCFPASNIGFDINRSFVPPHRMGIGSGLVIVGGFIAGYTVRWLSQTIKLPRTLDDAAFVVINGNFAIASGLKLSEAISLEKTPDHYLNVVAVKADDKDKAWTQDIVAAFKSKEYKAVLDKSFQGYARPAYLQ